jgi:hypothetical protein
VVGDEDDTVRHGAADASFEGDAAAAVDHAWGVTHL